MLTWNADLEREDVLLQLQEVINFDTDKVKVFIDELPPFIDNRVKLSVFKKQLSGYPKQIEFVTKNINFVQLFKEAGLPITLPNFNPNHSLEIDPNINLELEIEPEQEQKNILPSIMSFNFPEEKEVESVMEPAGIEIRKILKEELLTEVEVTSIDSEVTNDDSEGEDVNPQEEKKSFLKVTDVSIRVGKKKEEKILIKKIDFNNFSDFNLKLDLSKSVSEGDFTKMSSILDDVVEDDLDEMLSNLDRVRLNISDTNTSFFIKKPLRTLVATGFCCFIVFGFTGYLNYVPSFAYRINVKNNSQLKQELISISPSVFKEKLLNLSIYSEQQIPKQKKEFFERAKGKIVLFSSGANSCSLSNGGFLVNSGEKYFRVLPNLIYGTNVVIKSYSQSNPTLTFEVEALNKGGDQNIEKDTVLNLASIYKENLSKNCYAKTLTGLFDFNVIENNTVTQDIINTLQEYSSKAIDQKVNDELLELNNKNLYTKPEWVEQDSAKNLFNSEVGEIKDLVTLNRVEGKKVKYLPLDLIAKQIQNNITGDNREVKNVKISKLEPEGTQFKAEVTYDLVEKNNIDSAKVKDLISKNQDKANIEEIVQQEFPNVEKVQKLNEGINIPVFKKITVDIIDLY